MQTGICDVCGILTDVSSHVRGMVCDIPQDHQSVNTSKVSVCRDCYDMKVIETQIEYWKDHISEERTRSV